MQFKVPQFFEYETKILGPLSFKQLIIMIVILTPAIISYFLLPFIFFIIITLVFLGIGLFLTLGKKQGVPIMELIIHFFGFSTKPKKYFWQKKEKPISLETKIYKKSTTAIPKIKKEESLPLKIGEKSRLKKLLTEIEIYKKNK